MKRRCVFGHESLTQGRRYRAATLASFVPLTRFLRVHSESIMTSTTLLPVLLMMWVNRSWEYFFRKRIDSYQCPDNCSCFCLFANTALCISRPLTLWTTSRDRLAPPELRQASGITCMNYRIWPKMGLQVVCISFVVQQCCCTGAAEAKWRNCETLLGLLPPGGGLPRL